MTVTLIFDSFLFSCVLKNTWSLALSRDLHTLVTYFFIMNLDSAEVLYELVCELSRKEFHDANTNMTD